MSYLVLARKWRPRRFSELVGQEHVVRALSNALESGRIHHAFLFAGTRGVGKTTIARIFAKSLNCERGVGAEPCGECDVCVAVDQGRFVDLLEIDAASNTGVDDVRELIENAQYLPTRGRCKVYLIDEVHMLSRNAFNALLKTLEEPPEHVKFLLATTDPQKLPVTVLSRCLQFNLRRLSPEQIGGQLRRILEAEGVAAEDGAIQALVRAADGSLRDGLSLLDQALAFGSGELTDADVRSMLGTVERHRIAALLDTLAAADGAGLMGLAAELADFSPDFGGVLDELALALHRIQIEQLAPGSAPELEGIDLPGMAAALAPETVQLWYQMAILGRRDLPLAPSAQVGFEMSLLRMLAFEDESSPAGAATPASRETGRQPARRTASPARGAEPAHSGESRTAKPEPAPPAPTPTAAAVAPAQRPVPAAPATEPVEIRSNEDWLHALERCQLSGPARELAASLVFDGVQGDCLRVHLPPAQDYLRQAGLPEQLIEALSAATGRAMRLEFTRTAPQQVQETLGERQERAARRQEEAAEQAFTADPGVRELLEQGGKIRPGSIRARPPG